MPHPKGISSAIIMALNEYAHSLGAHEPLLNLWPTVMHEVEQSLLSFSLTQARGNKSLAAQILGINRNTLYKKLEHHKMIDKTT